MPLEPTTYVCPHCFHFATAHWANFQSHIRTEHPGKAVTQGAKPSEPHERGVFTCPNCGETRTNLRYLITHIDVMHDFKLAELTIVEQRDVHHGFERLLAFDSYLYRKEHGLDC